MQCKDIQDLPILEFLYRKPGVWHTWGEGYSMPTVQDAMPPGTSRKLQLAKMRMLIRRKLINGCPCGCRGDFELISKGEEFLRSAAVTVDKSKPGDLIVWASRPHVATCEGEIGWRWEDRDGAPTVLYKGELYFIVDKGHGEAVLGLIPKRER